MQNTSSLLERGEEAIITSVERRTPYLERVIIRNFRGIKEVSVELEPRTTILAGRNNAGKSRIISAIQLALGGRGGDPDDFTVGESEIPTIDVFFSPQAPESVNEDTIFEKEISNIFRTVSQTVVEDPEMEKIAWRTTVTRTNDGIGAKTTSNFLRFDMTTGNWSLPGKPDEVSYKQRRVFAVDLINTGRDLRDELGRQGSAIRRVLSDLEVPEEERGELETGLVNLSARILASSATLASVSEELSGIHEVVGSVGKPAISALPITLEELGRAISVDLDTGSGALPIRMHGSGSRSLSSLQIQRVLYDRRLGKDGMAVPPTPITLIEEPEAHLHPQAVMELPYLFDKLSGQKVISTHSAHLVTSARPECMRLVHQTSKGMIITDLGPASDEDTATHRVFRPKNYVEELEKLKRLVERPFGELLFSSAIVMGDGATERAFLPAVFRKALKDKAHGISVVDPGSLSTGLAAAVVKFSVLARLPLFIFADSDESGKKAIAELEKSARPSEIFTIWIDNDESGKTISGGAAIESMLANFDAEICWEACRIIRPDGQGTLLKQMKKIKGSSGAILADLLINKYPDPEDWPAPIRNLVSAINRKV